MRARLRLLAAVVVGVASLAHPTRAADDVVLAIKAELRHAATPADRINLLPRLAALETPGAALALAERLRSDPDARVRAAAARCLGTSRAEGASGLLITAAEEGGPRVVREAVARALSRRPGGVERVVEALEAPGTSEADAVMLLMALAGFHDPVTLAFVLARAKSPSREVRNAAVRVLSMRRDARDVRLQAVLRALGDARDDEDVLTGLDAADALLDPLLEPAVRLHAASPHPAVRSSATYVLARIRAASAAPAKAPAPGAAHHGLPDDRYAPPDDGAEPPGETVPTPFLVPRGRVDVVYAVDVTGSTAATFDMLRRRIADEMALLTRVDVSLRVGVVAYRGGHGPDARKFMSVLPLCFDLSRVTAFLDKIDNQGVDDHGAAVASALRVALDLACWRWDATRDVHVLADSGCDDVEDAKLRIGVHFQGDGTRTSIAYVERTRTRVPVELDELARIGGTLVAERVK